MHVESISLRNFQKHRKLKLDLVPGINVITGESNRGKSSIIRAFMRLCSNTPTGATCIRFGKKQADVEAVISTDDGKRTIKYSKSKSGGTSYSVDQQHYKRCGRSVPEEVSRTLRIIPEINIQPQYRQFFLLDARSGQERAKQLARGTNIDIIGYVITEARRQVNGFEGQAKAKEAEATEADAELHEYAELEVAEKQLARVNKLLPAVEELSTAVEAVKTAGTAFLQFVSYEKLFEKLPSIHDIESCITILQEKHNVLVRLVDANNILHTLALTNEHTDEAVNEAQRLQNLVDEIRSKQDLLALMRHAQSKNSEEAEVVGRISKLKKSIGNVCVTCGRPL